MTCHEDVLPLFVALSLVTLALLLLLILKEFLYQGGYKKGKVKKGLPWNIKNTVGEAEHLEDIKRRYGNLYYLISYGYVFLMNELFNHSVRSFIVAAISMLIATKILLVFC